MIEKNKMEWRGWRRQTNDNLFFLSFSINNLQNNFQIFGTTSKHSKKNRPQEKIAKNSLKKRSLSYIKFFLILNSIEI